MIQRKSEIMTSEYALKMYIAEKTAQGLSARTIKYLERDLDRFLKYAPPLHEITSIDVSTVIKELLETKKPVTVNHYVATYRAFLYWCMENEYVKPFKIHMVKCQEAPIRLYSIEDIEKLLKRPSKSDSFSIWRTWAMVAFVMGTGARSGTLRCIRLEDLDLERQEVVYRHSKNKHAPIIPICDELKSVLQIYLKEFELTDWLFPNCYGDQIKTMDVNRKFKRYCELRGVVHNSFHALRHTYAKQFILNGGNPFQLQKMLDHSSLGMSQHYTHLFGTDLHGVVNDFSPLSKIKSDEEKKAILRRKK